MFIKSIDKIEINNRNIHENHPMDTTPSYEISTDFFSTPQIANARKECVQTNPRHRGFNQSHFTVGDPFQFEDHRYPSPTQIGGGGKQTIGDIFKGTDFDIWDGHHDVTKDTVTDTFNYIFHKFKKGIFVKIKDNELKLFLPFSKANYTNEWSHKIEMDHSQISELMRDVTVNEGYKFNPKRVNSNVNEWYGNNSLLRYEFPINEGDSNVGNVKNMMEELCRDRKIPDTEFFINRRDFPLLTRDGMEPYHNMWDSTSQPLVSHSYEKYMPILGMVTNNWYADIPIPTHNDWARVQSKDGKWFPKCSSDYDDTFDLVKWEDKKETAIFRGASTGTGVDTTTNMRLKAAKLSMSQTKCDTPLLDAGITKWNLRPRKIEGCGKLQTIDVKNCGLKLSDYMTVGDQAGYKYILHIDGHVAAFRLSMELATRSVILLVKSQWKMWYSDKLQPYVHYVPVSWDMSDLLDVVQWCRDNDDKCKEIAENARKFYDTYLGRDGILDHLQLLVTSITDKMKAPKYPDVKPITAVLAGELEDVMAIQSNVNLPTGDYETNKIFRTEELFDRTHEKIKHIIATSNWEDEAGKGDMIFTNKLSRVVTCNYDGMIFAVKCTSDVQKTEEHVHESYVGMKVTNVLARKTQNFAYTYGTYTRDDTRKIITEFIHGQTLYDYITASKNFDFRELRQILVQVFLALDTAQRDHGFVHNDLTPWNIIIRRPPGTTTSSYNITPTKTVSMKTRAVPILIDFGKSTVKVDDESHHILYPATSSMASDAITLIMTTVKTLVSTRLSREDVDRTIDLVNVLAGTGYLEKNIRTIRDLRAFLKANGKYADLLLKPKYELGELRAMDFVNKMRKHVYIEEQNKNK